MNREPQKLNIRALVFGSLVTAFEWYDYALFGYFAAIIGAQYFPSDEPMTSLLSSFAVFASGFAMRPLGAIWFGYIGDKLGRKRALSLSLVLMAIPTTALGLLPSYDSIGIFASISLVVIRLLQGLAVGGNYGGSFIFAIENAPERQKGLAGSLAMFGTLGGLFLGVGAATLMEAICGAEYVLSFGWRIPFLFGALSPLIILMIRNKVPETRSFEEIPNAATPIKEVLRHHLPNVLRGIGVILLEAVGIYVVFVFMTTYATHFLELPQRKVFLINTICMASLVVFIPFFGWLGDKIGQKRLLQGACCCYVLLPIPFYTWLIQHPSLTALVILQAVFSIVIGAVYGGLPAMVVTAFPKNIRYTACGLAFNISVAVFGGTSPFIVTGLIKITGLLIVPALMLSVVGVVSFLSLRKFNQIGTSA